MYITNWYERYCLSKNSITFRQWNIIVNTDQIYWVTIAYEWQQCLKGRKKLGIFCYKVPVLCIKWYRVIWS